MDHDPDRDPLLEDDETLDFLLYREMEREGNRPAKGGCLGGLLLLLVPAGLLLLGGAVLLERDEPRGAG